MMVYGSFFFLILTVAFIIMRRLFYREFYTHAGNFLFEEVKGYFGDL